MPDLRKKKPIALVSDVVSNPSLFCRSDMQTCVVCVVRPPASPLFMRAALWRSCSTELNLGLFWTTLTHLLISLSLLSETSHSPCLLNALTLLGQAMVSQ